MKTPEEALKAALAKMGKEEVAAKGAAARAKTAQERRERAAQGIELKVRGGVATVYESGEGCWVAKMPDGGCYYWPSLAWALIGMLPRVTEAKQITEIGKVVDAIESAKREILLAVGHSGVLQ